MSEVCNAILALDDKALEEKSSLGWSVSIAVHAALSNCYKAIETLEINRAATGAEIVYLRAATSKLETAAEALRRMREILAEGSLSEAAIAWLKALDYDRLYVAGTKRGQIPAVIEQWNRLVELKRPLDHLAVANCLISDVEDLRREIHSLIDILLSGTPGAPLSAEQAERVPAIQTALVQFSTFAQMVSYLNAVEPMDPRWCRDVDMADLKKRDHGTRVLQ
jgi:hypothetical protein